jgi:hypothetical protein
MLLYAMKHGWLSRQEIYETWNIYTVWHTAVKRAYKKHSGRHN